MYNNFDKYQIKKYIFGLDLFCFTRIPIKSNKYIYNKKILKTHTQYIIAWDPTTK
jgi:hypothetical protein